MVVLLVIAGLVSLAAWKIKRDKKAGRKCTGCSGCDGAGSCPSRK